MNKNVNTYLKILATKPKRRILIITSANINQKTSNMQLK